MLSLEISHGEVWAESGGAVQLFEDRDVSKAAAGGGVRPGPLRGLRPKALCRPRREGEAVDLVYSYPSLLPGQRHEEAV